jgi:hypothetical protein
VPPLLGYHLGYGRGVAQPGSALAWGARGRKFESCRPDQYLRDAGGTSVVPSVVPILNDVFQGDSLGN